MRGVELPKTPRTPDIELVIDRKTCREQPSPHLRHFYEIKLLKKNWNILAF
jgi:hypothetical protein